MTVNHYAGHHYLDFRSAYKSIWALFPSYYVGYTPQKVGFYKVNFFLLFSNKSQDPTFDFYNLAHSDVTVFHSFKPKVEKIFMTSNK